jgi:hypothetical protein
LVKRAASVYLQSAALLATRNQNCIVAFWERVKSRASSWWRHVGGNTIRACFLPVFQFLNHIGSFRSLPWNSVKKKALFVKNKLVDGTKIIYFTHIKQNHNFEGLSLWSFDDIVYLYIFEGDGIVYIAVYITL